jgi:hypothetical protein
MSFPSERFCLSVLVIVLSLAAEPQRSAGAPPPAPDPQSAASISFSFSFPGAAPSDYKISLDAAGLGQYESQGAELSPQPSSSPYSGIANTESERGEAGAAEVYKASFSLPEPSLRRIFGLAAAANYFNGSFDYKKKGLANTGVKTLAYADSARHFQTVFNFSTNPAISQLTALFQGLSGSLEAARRLEYLYNHHRLGLDDELKRDDELSGGGQMAEIGVLAPILRRITADPAVMHVARQHAQRLLDRATSTSPRK